MTAPTPTKTRRHSPTQWMALCAAALLAGCGGGGGGSSAPTATSQTSPQQPAPTQTDDTQVISDQSLSFPQKLPYDNLPSFTDAQLKAHANAEKVFLESPEFKRSWHLERINAHKAYARGATGRGEIVGVIDSNLYLEHPEFDGGSKIVAAHPMTTLGAKDPRFERQTIKFSRPVSILHGTEVAAAAVGARGDQSFGSNVQGVAYDAKLAFWNRGPLSYGDLISHDNTKFFNDYGAAIVNISIGSGDSIDDYPKKEVREKWKDVAAKLAQADTDDADKIIFVFGAGNDYLSSVSRIAGLGVHFPELRGHVLAVTGVDSQGNSIFNKCGSAKAFCLAAPAKNIWTASMYLKDYTQKKKETKKEYKQCKRRHKYGCLNPDYGSFTSDDVEPIGPLLSSGTSYAAPQVTGALAVMRQFFSVDHADGTRSYSLGNTELVARLLATANNKGIYSDSDKFGHGLLDLDAATTPYGMLMDSLSTDPNARPFNPAAFSLSGNAFGGAMRDALGGVKIAAFDELDAPFFFPLADGVSHAPQISAGHSDTLHEHELSLGDAANASLALSLAAGELSAARIRRGNLWFSYGHHSGREAGLYFGDDGGNAIGNFGMNFSDETSAETSANAARHFRAPLAFASPYLSLVRDGPGLGWSQPLRSGARFGFSLMHGAPQFDHFQNPGGARGLGALFDFRPNNTSLSLQAGAVREADGFLGARAQGNFGEISADTAFAGIGGDWAAMQNWRLLASAYLGHTKADTGGGMLRAADDIVSSAFSLGLARAGLARRGDWLGLRLSQPLRAESGAAHLRIPAGRTKYREVLHRQHKLELTPSGRNLQVEAEYRVPFAGGALRAGLGFDRHADHDRARDLEGFLRLGFERRF